MDNVVVQVLAVGSPSEDWTAHTLELLGDASQLAKRLGGAVGAWILPPFPAKEAVDALGGFGCDAVTMVRGERLVSPERIAAALPLSGECRAILLPGGPRGEEIAALLAGGRNLQWVPDAISLSATRTGAVEVTAAVSGGKLSRLVRAAGEAPLVVTMREGVAEIRREAARAVVIDEVSPAIDGVEELTCVGRFLPADPRTQDITHARRIVAGGRGTGGPDGMELVGRLTDTLGASLAASRVAVDLGWAPPERQVGQTGRTVRPDLYVACGISGASHHLAGMRDSRHIVAINPDPKAPIHDIAHLSLRGDLRSVIPEVEKVIARRRGNA
jgi:electron transfer flavoprotein alpha subunit